MVARRRRPATGLAALLLLALAIACPPARAEALVLREAAYIAADDPLPPADDDPRWRPTRLPDLHSRGVVWYRLAFERPAAGVDEPWALYLPYLYGGGKLWLDDAWIAAVQESDAAVRVSWERPLLLPVPLTRSAPGPHVLRLRAAPSPNSRWTHLSLPLLGPTRELQPVFDRRLLWTRTVPTLTVAAGACVGALFLLVWWRRRDEVLYGLFGLAALLWALRTNTFVLDTWPAAWWPLWRLVQQAATGGFVVAMAAFALVMAGAWRRRHAAWLVAYWALGPLALLLGGDRGDALALRWWGLGLVAIGLGIVGLGIATAWRRRTAPSILLAAAMTLATATGVHDWLLASQTGWLLALAPDWAGQRVFLLHHGANLLLVAMAALLATRFVGSLREVEEMNRTLERRVVLRELEIGAGYARIAALQREQAALDERQRIVQDLHDGLGSRLMISLLQVERGALAPAGVAEALRGCIAEMRLAIETLGADDADFRAALGDFRFRWEAQLHDAGIASTWCIDPEGAPIALAPHATLQALRVLQEALTNVVRHAGAATVSVRLERQTGSIRLAVEDDGRGWGERAPGGGRGLANMRARAERLGGGLELASVPGATRVALTLPVDDAAGRATGNG